MDRVRPTTLLPLELRRRIARRLDELGPVSRQRTLSWLGRRLASGFYRKRPVPLRVIRALARLAGGSDPIRPKYERNESGGSLKNTFLASRLAKESFGGMRMTASALNFVEEEIRRREPKRILELGSGVSTACMARYMLELHGSNGPYVCSVDQDKDHVLLTRALLEKLGLDGVARVEWAPLVEQAIEEEIVASYELEGSEAGDMLQGLNADMLLIDGPAGEPFVRRPTLWAARPFLSSQATFLLDDALREFELQIAEEWAAKDGVQIEGIILAGQGLLLGTIKT